MEEAVYDAAGGQVVDGGVQKDPGAVQIVTRMHRTRTAAMSCHTVVRRDGDTFVPSIKTAILGQSAVGKTSLLLRATRDTFDDAQVPTIGGGYPLPPSAPAGPIRSHRCHIPPASFLAKGTKRVEWALWDTAGQERYAAALSGVALVLTHYCPRSHRSLAPLFYRDALVNMIVYDVTNAVRAGNLTRAQHA